MTHIAQLIDIVLILAVISGATFYCDRQLYLVFVRPAGKNGSACLTCEGFATCQTKSLRGPVGQGGAEIRDGGGSGAWVIC
ncbi:MAG: hypothetical protein OHK005_18130 [Candidatus Methylacidiphilales bacterium]